ncbi:MAG: hypothetical protein HY958_10295 [Bacteroidia bacterium]|nr:hypothetical protein [Bacteroidia bacterium]
MKRITLFLSIFIAGLVMVSFSQNCNDYILKFGNDKASSGFAKDVQSKSGLFKKGQSHKLNIVFSKNKDFVLKFYNSMPQNKVSYKMMTEAGEVLFNYDNYHLQKELKEKEEALKQKQMICNEAKSRDEEDAIRKEMKDMAAEVTNLKTAVQKDKNTVPTSELVSVTDPVNVVVEVTLEDTETPTSTSCIAVLVLNRPSEGEGFQDDQFTKVQKEAEARKTKQDADAKTAADAKAKADAEAKEKAEVDKKKKKGK